MGTAATAAARTKNHREDKWSYLTGIARQVSMHCALPADGAVREIALRLERRKCHTPDSFLHEGCPAVKGAGFLA
jgi:hypothetical protein